MPKTPIKKKKNQFMRFLSLYLLVILLISLGKNTEAQFYNNGQNRANTQWQQIESTHFRLVFPDYAEKQAQLFANKLLWAAANVPTDLAVQPRKIDIVMIMESSTANAMVVWAPRRMEAHALQSQDSYAEEWFEQLALHEYRHVVQIEKLNIGFTKIISLVFGEMGTSLVLGAYLPLWYLEGDAVSIETAMSNTGRGRMADFAMPLRAQLLTLGAYSYDKASMGSYKTFIPDHYILGYQLVKYGNEQFGQEFWKNTETFVARNPYFVVPFSHAIYTQSGLRKKAFYQHCMLHLDSVWRVESFHPKTDIVVQNQSKHFISYPISAMLNDSVLVALKKPFGEISQLVSIHIKTGEEKKILIPGYGDFNNLSIRDSFMVWTERRYHPRWEQVKYHVVMKYDFRNEKKQQITHRSNLSFPVLSADAKQIAAISQSLDGNYQIEILSSADGKKLETIACDAFIKNITFNELGNKIYFYRLRSQGFELIEYDLHTKIEKQLLKPSYNNRNWIAVSGDSLVYIDDKNGISDLYLLNLKTQQTAQISQLSFGASAVYWYNKQLIFSSYSANGWQIHRLEKKNISAIAENQNPLKKPDLKQYISDTTINIQQYPPQFQHFTSKRYAKLPHALKIHSWGPVAVHANNTESNPGISIMSQNLLSSLDVNIGYEYLMSEASKRSYLEINYSGLFPRINLIISEQGRLMTDMDQAGNITEYHWNERNIILNISEGLRLDKGAFVHLIQPYSSLYWQELHDIGQTPDWFPNNKTIISMRYGFYSTSYRRYGQKDLYPHWGYNLRLEYRHTPFGDLDYGSVRAIQTNLYLPAFGKHHNIRIYYGQQAKTVKTYLYYDLIQWPVGVIALRNDRMQSLKINYDLPLLYPDWSLGSIIYLKRVKASFFSHFSQSEYLTMTQNYSAYGLDLQFDLHLLRTIAPLDLGLRTAYLPNHNNPYFEFLFSVNY